MPVSYIGPLTNFCSLTVDRIHWLVLHPLLGRPNSEVKQIWFSEKDLELSECLVFLVTETCVISMLLIKAGYKLLYPAAFVKLVVYQSRKISER